MRKIYFSIIIVVLVIGFAALGTKLLTSGTIKFGVLEDDYDVYFSMASINEIENKSFISDDKNSIVYEGINLSSVGDIVELGYEITNGSTQYDSEIELNCISDGDSEFITITHQKDFDDIIKAREKGTGKIIIKLEKPVVENTSINMTCNLVTNATGKEYDENVTIENYRAFEIDYTNSEYPEVKTVEDALNDLFQKYGTNQGE